jgi:hypothetical protein
MSNVKSLFLRFPYWPGCDCPVILFLFLLISRTDRLDGGETFFFFLVWVQQARCHLLLFLSVVLLRQADAHTHVLVCVCHAQKREFFGWRERKKGREGVGWFSLCGRVFREATLTTTFVVLVLFCFLIHSGPKLPTGGTQQEEEEEE